MGVKKKETGTSLFGGKAPVMPEGYYSGDQPNPNLRAFVEQQMRNHPYDALHDNYDVPAFDHPIETTKATAIYAMHAYWSKKPHDAIQQYVRHYTRPGDLVLDPFCGSGSTALAAILEGRAAIAIDRSPAAAFITKNYCTPVNVDEVHGAFEELQKIVKPEIDWLYETRCEKCSGPAHTLYTVYSQVYQCPECGEKIASFDCPETAVEKHGKPKKVRVCPFCKDRGKTVEINARCAKFGAVPVTVSYECLSGCSPRRDQRSHNDPDLLKRKYFDRYDMGKIREIESMEIPHWYPRNKMMNIEDDGIPWGDEWREGRNFRSIGELYTKRSLWALAALRNGIEGLAPGGTARDSLLFAWSATLLGTSRMVRESNTATLSGTYYLPPISKEIDVLPSLRSHVGTVVEGLSLLHMPRSPRLSVSCQTATDLSGIPDSSVDAVFTDPPYGGTVQYGELNFVWEAWLDLDTKWQKDEIVINQTRGKSEQDWTNMMEQAMAECYRVLKPGRWISLCYHDTSEGTWTNVQDLMAKVGFVVASGKESLYIDAGQKSYNQTTGSKVTKRDLVMNFRKPRPGEAAADVRIDDRDTGETLNDKVRAIVTDYLTDHAGATKDRIWDTVASRLVRQGQMQPHDFEALLHDVANEVAEAVKKDLFNDEPADIFGTHVIGHWYLKSTAYAVEDETERSKEDAAAAVMHSFIDEFLSDYPEQDGVHYSDLFEHYLTHVADKPRRRLAEWLPDYFFFTTEGTWRLPATSDEEELKVHERQQGTGRRIRRYLAYLQHHADIPEEERPTDVTLADWIRHCKRAGMYEQGRLLYEQGGLILDHLTEEQQVNVQEDYGVCVRKLAEQQVIPKRRRKAKEDADDLF